MRRQLAPALASLVIAGCASLHTEPAAADAACCAAPAKAADAAGAADDAQQKLADLAEQSDLARMRLDRARIDAEQQQMDAALAADKARFDLDAAKKALDHFTQVEAPQKKAREELSLQQMVDAATEQEEELAQLEMMYKNDDLADKTKEIVLARTKRRLERVRTSLALQKQELNDLLTVQQPLQQDKLMQAVRDAEAALRRATVAAKTGQMDKTMAIHSQELEVQKLEREIAKAKKAAGAAAAAPAK